MAAATGQTVIPFIHPQYVTTLLLSTAENSKHRKRYGDEWGCERKE